MKTTALEELRNRLKAEAKAFVERNSGISTDRKTFFRQVSNLSGFEFSSAHKFTDKELAYAHQEISTKIRQVRKSRRTNSALYDSNQHIALHQALKKIVELQKSRPG